MSGEQFYLLDTLQHLPVKATDEELQWLGCVLKKVDYPNLASIPRPSLPALSASDYVHSEVSDFEAIIKRAKSKTLKASLADIIGGEHSSSTELDRTVKRDEIEYFQLKNQEAFLQRLAKIETYRAELDPWLNLFGTPPYLIVGFLVTGSIKKVEEEKKPQKKDSEKHTPDMDATDKDSTKNSVNVDPAKLAAVVTGGPAAAAPVSTKVEADFTTNNTKTIKGSPKGRYIFALQCWGVKRELFKRTAVYLGTGPKGDKRFGEGDEKPEDTEVVEQYALGQESMKDLLEEDGVKVNTEKVGDFHFVFNRSGENDEEEGVEDEDEEDEEESEDEEEDGD